jgi:hypothetical protein
MEQKAQAAIGVRVTVTAGDLVQFNEVRSGAAIFHRTICDCTSLGNEPEWTQSRFSGQPGKKEVYKDLSSDLIYTIVEGEGISQRAH